MINRSEIMKRAWQIMKAEAKAYSFMRYSRSQQLSLSLRKAWAEAKAQAPLTAEQKAEKIAALESQINVLQFKPLGHNIAKERAAIERQIAALAA